MNKFYKLLIITNTICLLLILIFGQSYLKKFRHFANNVYNIETVDSKNMRLVNKDALSNARLEQMISSGRISKDQKDATIAEATFTGSQDVQKLYQLLKDITEIFEKANLKYMISDGTLLGAARHKGLVPWDDDIDIMIFSEDIVKFTKLQPVFNSLGYNIINNHNMYKIGVTKNKGSFTLEHPTADIFIMHHDKVNQIVEYFQPNDLIWFNTIHDANKIFPLEKKYKYGPLTLYGPKDIEYVMTKNFGHTWRSQGVIIPNHSNIKFSDKFNIEIKGIFSSPALPQYELQDRTNDLQNLIDEVLVAPRAKYKINYNMENPYY